jgi:hypothetical protein
MHEWFGSRPISIAEGVALFGIGVLLLLFLEAEKALARRLGLLRD